MAYAVCTIYLYILYTTVARDYIYVYRNRSNQPWFISYVVVFFGAAVIFLPITTKHVFRKTQSAAVKIQQHNILQYCSVISKYII